MPYQEPDPTDPGVLVGVSLPAGAESHEEMARAFAEEFAAMGRDADWILGVFRNPHYAAAHEALRKLGSEAIRAIVEEAVGVFGRLRFVTRDAPQPPRDLLQIE